jgi:hypothetical protein
MGKAVVILCLCLLGAGCESTVTTSANVSSDEVFFPSSPPPGGTHVGWTSFNDHLTWHYADDATAHMRQDAAAKGANVVVLLGVDPPDTMDPFGPFEVYGYLATVYVWADLYYCPGLTNCPSPEMANDKVPRLQLANIRLVPSSSLLFAVTGIRPPLISPAGQLK